MKTKQTRKGFSLIEVNMAIYVMAVGVLAMLTLYPLGLRENIQSRADLKQSMFADYILNVVVSAACNPELPWNEWKLWARDSRFANVDDLDIAKRDSVVQGLQDSVQYTFIRNALLAAGCRDTGNGIWEMEEVKFAVYCVPVPSFSSQIMGIMVRSLADMDTTPQGRMAPDEILWRLEAQPVYYAEARFQGTF